MVYEATINNHIFREHPLDDESWYYASTFMEKRLEITADGYLNLTHVPYRTITNQGINKIKKFAPYELDLLNRIYECQRRFFILQGGTGCGKSSCIRYIKDKCDSILSENWRKRNHLRSFLGRLDLQNCYSKPSTEKNDDIQELQKFLNNVASDLLNHLRDLIDLDRDMASLQLGKQICNTEAKIDRLRWTISEWLSELEVSAETLIECGDDNDFKELGEHIFMSVDREWGEQKLNKALDLAAIMSLWLEGNSSDLIICIDNADKIPTHFLNELILQITFIDDIEYLENSNIKIFMHLRMSTIKDTERTHPNIAVKSSSSLSPYLAVVMRIIIYLVSEQRQNNYLDSRSEAQLLDSVLLEALVRLVEPHSPLSEILESMSGSNLRRGFEIMKKWLSDSNQVHSRFPVHDQTSNINQSILVLLCSMWLRNIVADFFEEVVQILTKNSGVHARRTLDQLSGDELDTIAELNSHLRNELLGLFLFEKRHLSSLPERIQIGVSESREIGAYLTLMSKDAPTVSLRIQNVNRLNDISEMVSDMFYRYWPKELELNALSDQDLVQLLKTIWQSSKYIENDNFKEHEIQLSLLKSWSKSFSRKVKTGSVAPRFMVSCELLNAYIQKKGKFKPYNVLTGNTGKTDLAGLWCLCLLRAEYFGNKKLVDAKPYITGQVFVTKMKAVGYNEGETRRALMGLIRPSYRLIFASTFDKDHFKNGSWLHKEFYFSWCGFFFVTKLLGNMHYLEWCMFECDEIRKKNFHTLSKKDLIYYHEDSKENDKTDDVKNSKIDTAAAVVGAMKTISELIDEQELGRLANIDQHVKAKEFPNIQNGTPLLSVGYQLSTQFRSLIEYVSDEVNNGVQEYNNYIDSLSESLLSIEQQTHRDSSGVRDALNRNRL